MDVHLEGAVVPLAFTLAAAPSQEPTLSVQRPDCTTGFIVVTEVDDTHYTANVLADQAGQWWFRWAVEGAVVDSEEGTFLVTPSMVDA